MLPRSAQALRRNTKYVSSPTHFKPNPTTCHNDINGPLSRSRYFKYQWKNPFRAYSTGSSFSSKLLDIRSSWTTPRVIVAFLVSGGVAATAYGLYQLYSTLTIWPPEVRGDLRAGLRAKHQGSLKLAAKHFSDAYDTALEIPLSKFVPEPYLKLSGIAIALAEVLEEDERYKEASVVLENAFRALAHALIPPSEDSEDATEERIPFAARCMESLLTNAKSGADADEQADQIRGASDWIRQAARRFEEGKVTKDDYDVLDQAYVGRVLFGIYMTMRERFRMVALALKIAELQEKLEQPGIEAFYLMFAAREVTHIMKDEYETYMKVSRTMSLQSNDHRQILRQIFGQPVEKDETTESKIGQRKQHEPTFEFNLEEALATRDDNGLGLPSWSSLTRLELLAPFERLASYSARQKVWQDAEGFYRNAIFILRSSSRNKLTYTDVCRLLQLESGHLSTLIELRRMNVLPKDEIESSLKRNATLMRLIAHYERAMLGKQSRSVTTDDDSTSGADVVDELPPRSRPRARAAAVALEASGASVKLPSIHDSYAWSLLVGEKATEDDVRLCELSSAAYMYNMGIYYEDFGSPDQAMTFLRSAYGILSAVGDKENIRDVAGAIRRVQKKLDSAQVRTQEGQQEQSTNPSLTVEPKEGSQS